MDKYEKLEKVGEGTYDKVYRAKDKATGQLVALKKTHLKMDEEGIPPIFLDIYHRGPNTRPLPTHLVKNFLYQLCKEVAHCHAHGVLHRDLKPQNLLVDKEKGILKIIADLGLSRAFTVPMTSYTREIVTLWYRAPEVLLGTTHYSTGVHMWYVGCIFAEMVRRQALFPGDSELQQLLHICRLLGTPTEEQWPGLTALRDWHEFPQWKPQSLARAVPTLEPEGIDLLSKMLQLDPSNRISAKAAMEHPYFDSLDKSQF
ncbi:cyclin-dependent kinase B1-1-like isoform X2 [Phragmites australis]|uniref:cyclin-dependent kinase B1-1-like isoform X2 n=1 Tax=Phragmites australis TaxID=29695 RepID=UPI002D788BF3|nr:cyclin-dependent kinase B1-1-like isoform X2 [Phragmites australis]